MNSQIEKQRLAILGGGELGRQVAHYAKLDGRYDVVGFLDDTIQNGTIVAGIRVLGDMNDVLQLYSNNTFDSVFIGVGYDHFDFKSLLYEKIKT